MSARLILASSSPQRRQLLADAGYQFEVVPPHKHVECGVCSTGGPAKLVRDLALRKAADVVQQLMQQHQQRVSNPLLDLPPQTPPWLVVACDTVAECGGEVLGKPRDRQHAAAMLRRLRGTVHRVYSGLCLWPSPLASPVRPPTVDGAVSELRMDEVSDAELEAYLDSGLWRGKAGAFGLQDRVGWIRVVAGSESNVVGMPMELFAKMLSGVS
jgi:septum formation protein